MITLFEQNEGNKKRNLHLKNRHKLNKPIKYKQLAIATRNNYDNNGDNNSPQLSQFLGWVVVELS